MKRMLSFTALLILFLSTHFNIVQAQGIDELMDRVDIKADDYRFLAEQISDLSDELAMSNNELDSKGDELKQFVKDLTETIKAANSVYKALENAMDTFESGCFNMVEEKCPGLKEEVEKFTWEIEPVIELGAEPIYILDEIDNRYDEKWILKTLAKAQKAALKVSVELDALKKGLMALEEKCN